MHDAGVHVAPERIGAQQEGLSGGVRRMRGCIIAGSMLAIQEAATLMATISSSTPPPSSASLLWRRMDVMSSPDRQ